MQDRLRRRHNPLKPLLRSLPYHPSWLNNQHHQVRKLSSSRSSKDRSHHNYRQSRLQSQKRVPKPRIQDKHLYRQNDTRSRPPSLLFQVTTRGKTSLRIMINESILRARKFLRINLTCRAA